MKVESRRLQRLGTSSLVVTLPKEWVKRFNLKPGDAVLVFDEGDSVRIAPQANIDSSIIVEAQGMDISDVARGLMCLYIMGYNDIKLKTDGLSIVELSRVKNALMRLQGIEVVEEDDGSIRVRYVADPSKVNIKLIIKSMGITVGRAVSLLLKVLDQGGNGEEVVEAASSIRLELLRYQHQAMRYLIGRLGSDSKSYALLMGTGLLGLVGDFAVETILAIASRKLEITNECRPLVDEIKKVSEIIPQLSSILVTPSKLRSSELIKKIADLSSRIKAARVSNIEACSYLVARFEDIVRTALVVANIAFCSSFVDKMV